MVLIELVDVKKRIRNEEILKGISLKVYAGEFLSIIGASGSGKSSLLYIMGLLDFPTEGKVFFKGQEIEGTKGKLISKIRNESIGFVFQFHYLLPEFTLLENVVMPMLKRGIDRQEAEEKARQLLQRLGLGKKEMRKIYQISGGEMQRVAIARALANDPEVILADEPTGNLDSKNTQMVMEIFQEINRAGTAIVMVTHELYLAERAHRIVEIRDGEVVSVKAS
ncbi:MAG: ABC transporter ATP-binding protein [Hydrogenobacter thermophilus]|uniref:ABC transporter ATP-binding protein n=1 Tax=Hydrogenobacter thermophilus TaxID=940 RepID=UPI001C75393F|nr:ABC transporter ATP-binding protein [Hydrogenobacter thermophilus]QWK19224.1 MAG: ABC transporter ATP-binding protein [Hydrogenobacter thermophilus]